MSQFDPASLVALTDRPVTAGIIASADHESWRDDVEDRVSDLNSLAQALSTMQSGASAPTNNTIQGQVWFDTANGLWKGDPDGAGADDEFLTKLKAYTISLATGGTAVFKLGGRVETNTTQAARTTTGVFTGAFTIPANTLDVDGKYIYGFWGGTMDFTGTQQGAVSFQVRFGATPTSLGTMTFPDINETGSAVAWIIEAWVFRTGAATQKAFARLKLYTDASGSTSLVVYATPTETLANPLTFDLNLSAVNASDSVTKEACFWKYQG